MRFGTVYVRRARPWCFHAFHASRAAKMSATQPNAAAGKMMMAQITAGADIGFVHLFNVTLSDAAAHGVAWTDMLAPVVIPASRAPREGWRWSWRTA